MRVALSVVVMLSVLASPARAATVLFQPRDDSSHALEVIDTVMGRAHVLSRAAPGLPALAVNARGDAITAWIDHTDSGNGTVSVATRAGAHGRWTHSRRLGYGDVQRPAVAVDAHGRVVIGWTGSAIFAATGRAGRPLGAPRRIGAPPQGFSVVLGGAGAGPGGLTVVWGRSSPGGVSVLARDVAPDGHFAAPVELAPDGRQITVASDPRGGLLVGWLKEGGLEAVVRRGVQWPATQTISASSPRSVVLLGAAIGRTGDAALTSSVDHEASLTRIAADGTTFPPFALGTSAASDDFPQALGSLAVDRRGTISLAWPRNGRLELRTQTMGGPLRTRSLRGDVPATDLAPGVPALVPAGSHTLATWQASNGRTVTLFGERTDATKPRVIARRALVARAAPASACRPRGRRVFRRSSRAVATTGRDDVAVCLLARGTPVAVDPETPLGAVSLAGPFATWADTSCDAVTCDAVFTVADLRDLTSRRTRDVPLPGSDAALEARLRSDGTVAVVTCEPTHFDSLCDRAGDHAHRLLLSRPYRDPLDLGSARHIRRASLRFTRTELVWRDASGVHRAAAPYVG